MTKNNRIHIGRLLAVLMAFALIVAACGDDEASDTTAASETTAASDTASDAIQMDGFESLGEVTLSVWADSGEEASLLRAKELFEAQYPNVTIEPTLRGWDDLMAIIVNTMQSEDPPDVAQGNQGYSVDGAMVAGGLILPLDEYAAAYGWTDDFPAGAIAEFRFSEDGVTFGDGPMWGLSPVAEIVGIYYNKEKVAALTDTFPATFEEFDALLGEALAAGERPIQLGNSEAWPGVHLFGMVHAAFTPAEEIRAWVTGAPGATFDSDSTLQASQKIADWADAGYFGDDFNGVGNDDAVARFSGGDGVFFIAGNWNTATLAENMAANVGFAAMPVGPSGVVGGTGALGLGWHISSKTEHPDLAAAFVDFLHSEEFAGEIVSTGRVPVQPSSVAPEGLQADVVAASNTVRAADGLTFFADWATDTMFDTFSSKLQELLAGRIEPADFNTAVQTDWDEFFANR